jgi:hypothetical protein
MRVKRAIAWSAVLLSCSGKEIGRVSTADPGQGGAETSSGGSSGALIDASLGSVDAGTGGALTIFPRDSGSDGAPCASIDTFSDGFGFDLYIMVDASASMGETIPGSSSTWWDAVRGGISSFARTPSAIGFSVGLQYFPLASAPPESCQADYSTPDVELAPLPDNATNIEQSLARHAPAFGRPTGPALLGAYARMATRALDPNAAYFQAVVLVTNGAPSECEPSTVADLQKQAETVPDGPRKVLTYTILLGSSAPPEPRVGLGEEKWFSIPGGDVAEAVRTALLRVLYPSFVGACESFDLPATSDGSKLDPGRIAVTLESYISGHLEVPRVSSASDCDRYGGRGWYLSRGDARTTIELCPGTCADEPGSFHVRFGCLP